MENVNSFNSFLKLQHIIISGSRRSGTTLLQRLLDGHPRLLVYPYKDCIIRDYFFPTKHYDNSPLKNILETRNAANVFEILYQNPKLKIIFQKSIDNDFGHIGPNSVQSSMVEFNKFKESFVQLLDSNHIDWDIKNVFLLWMFCYFNSTNSINWTDYIGLVTKCPDAGLCTTTIKNFSPILFFFIFSETLEVFIHLTKH